MPKAAKAWWAMWLITLPFFVSKLLATLYEIKTPFKVTALYNG